MLNALRKRRSSSKTPFLVDAFFVSGVVALCVVIAGCVSSGSSSVKTVSVSSLPQLKVQASDFQYNMPDTMPAGLVAITETNNGPSSHQMNLGKVNSGVTDAQVIAALPGGEASIDKLITYVGGPNTVNPGQSQEVVVNLTPGRYFALCYVPASDGTPHYSKGMYKFFDVTQQSNSVMSGQIAYSETFIQRNFSFQPPANGVPSGPTTVRIMNQGTESHEFTLVKVADGKSVQDVITWVQSTSPTTPPPFSDAGGIAAIAPGETAYVLLNLQPGQYMALCYVLDVASGKPHVDLGMLVPFTVN